MIYTKEDEAILKLSFLKEIMDKCLSDSSRSRSLDILLKEFDDPFLSLSLLEEDSSTNGHPCMKRKLYVVRDDRLHPVDVRRETRVLYPVDYGHHCNYPSDVQGWSETVRGALSRQDLTTSSHVVLHFDTNTGTGNNHNQVYIVPLKK